MRLNHSTQSNTILTTDWSDSSDLLGYKDIDYRGEHSEYIHYQASSNPNTASINIC